MRIPNSASFLWVSATFGAIGIGAILAACSSTNASTSTPSSTEDAGADAADAAAPNPEVDASVSGNTTPDSAVLADAGMDADASATSTVPTDIGAPEPRVIGAMACSGDGGAPGALTASTPFAAPYNQLDFPLPAIPCAVFKITDYGAMEGGTTKNTAAFAGAVAAASTAGGGVVDVPAGTWLTGPIHLASNIELHVEAGATIVFSTDFTDYGFSSPDGGAVSTVPLVPTRWEGLDVMNGSPLVYCLNCTNVAITGSGTLYGQGAAWWNWKSTSATEDLRVYDAILGELGLIDGQGHATDAGIPDGGTIARPVSGIEYGLRPTMVECSDCTNFLIEDVTIKDGPYWIVHPVYSQNVIVRGAHIISGSEAPLDGGAPASNGDGFDPDSCKNVLIEDTDFNTSDDNIAIKSGLNEDGIFVNRPSEEVVVRRVTSIAGHGGMTIGSEMSGGVHNVFATGTSFAGTGIQYPLRYKTLPGRGGVISDVWYDQITLNGWTQGGIIIDMAYGSSTLKPFNPNLLPTVGNISFSNISGPAGAAGKGMCPVAADGGAPTCAPVTLRGNSASPLHDISFANVNLAGTGSTCVSAPNGVDVSNVNVAGIPTDGTWACP